MMKVKYNLILISSKNKSIQYNDTQQEISGPETMGLTSDSPPLIYLVCFTQLLDAYAIMIMLFDRLETQQWSQDSLILFDKFQTTPNT